mmetsp:Transcript_4486/g.6941  ORF Transcript_4486/g.6941 Transcript_4486/m.6941 type:complete len:316 (+) Transcript_4486:501-1448(+)
MAISMSRKHPLVKIAYWWERLFGRGAYNNFCVTRSMQKELATVWGIRASVLYDRPSAQFKHTQLSDQYELFKRLDNDSLPGVFSAFFDSPKTCSLRNDRPALIISSSSWGPDEDFNILLNAIGIYDKAASGDSRLPSAYFVVTGRGPLRQQFEESIKGLSFQRCRIFTVWLAAEDYPRLLGCADLGVSLHTSSSGLDLPMKVVDMFGCGVPVCALDFACLNELVDDGKNGLIFKDAEELGRQFQALLAGFPSDCSKLQSLEKEVASFQEVRWIETWDQIAWPVFNVTPPPKRSWYLIFLSAVMLLCFVLLVEFVF